MSKVHLTKGDYIQIVKFPKEWDKASFNVWQSTRRLYERLIKSRRRLRVLDVNKDGLPLIQCRFRQGSGWERHYLYVYNETWKIIGSHSNSKA